jgi:hypothetical protein
MRLFEEFLKRISSKILLTPKRLEAIAALDPSHIYVENVRALFGVSTGVAKRFCEFAVRQGVLQKRIEVRCPDQTVVDEARSIEELRRTVNCFEEVDGHIVEVSYETSRLKTSEFYVLRHGGAA